MGRETKVMKKQEKAENKETKATVKKIKKDIKDKKLNKAEKQEYYNEVYHLYGARVYRNITPEKLQKKDIKNLLKSGKFEDIYFKYGENKYNRNIGYMKAKYIEQETGNKLPKIFNRISNFIKRKIVPPMLGVALALPMSAEALDFMAEQNKNEERKQYLHQIEEYIDNIEEYAESVNKMNLSHEEVLMKVTKDMWENIKGYGTPQLDLIAYRGLDLAKEDGVGVCKNMADDVARKLNAINEEYNARVISVYHSGIGYKIADIPIKIVETDEQDATNNNINEELVKYIGNHIVVMVDIKEDNVTLILDPTNPGIGVIKNGQITMFNSTKESNFNEKITPILYNYIMGGDSVGLTGQLLGTFKKPNLSMEELEEKYGLEAQNRALESVRQKEKTFKDKLVIKIDENTNAIASLNRDEEVLEDIQVLEDVQELEDELDEH